MHIPTGTRHIPALLAVAAILGSVGCRGTSPTPWTPSPSASLATLHDEVRLPGLEDRRFHPDTWWRLVSPVVEGSGRFRVEVVGESAEGRPLRTISFGRGPVPVLLWSQMHGDESTASMALADLYALVARRPDHPAVRSILEGATVHTLPLLNPDGAARFQRRNVQGIDINRDARALSTPEGRTLKAVRDRLQPEFGFNLHDQGIGTRVGRTDRGVAIALLAPPFNQEREVNEVREKAMEVIGVMIQAMEPMVGGYVARYDDSFNPRAFGDLITQWGTSTILVESGGWADDPQKQYLRKVNFVSLLAALESIATGSYRGVGTELYEALPPNGRSVADLLVTGGTVVVAGLPSFRADLLVRYADPLLQEGGTISDVGDLAGTEARDTLSLTGMFIHLADTALARDQQGLQVRTGAPAVFTVGRREDGSQPLWSFRGSFPADMRSRR
jgi:hypothetical protein